MIKKITCVLVLFTIVSCTTKKHSSSDEINKSIIKQAYEMAEAMLNNENEKFMDKIYPSFITYIGGRQKMDTLLNDAYAELKGRSMTIDSVIFLSSNPIINTGTELQTSLPEIVFIRTKNGTLLTKSTVIAISKDKGVTWYFMDTSGKDLKGMKKMFPNLSKKIIIAPKEKPVLVSK